MDMQYLARGTFTGKAIRLATRQVFSEARPGVAKVAVVITDGQTDPSDVAELESAVSEASTAPHNIEMHAVGIHPQDLQVKTTKIKKNMTKS